MIDGHRAIDVAIVALFVGVGCASEPVSVPIAISLDPFTCTNSADDALALRCGGTLGVWIRQGQNTTHACIDIPADDLTVSDIGPLLQRVDLGELPDDQAFSLELAVYSPSSSGVCPDPLDDPTLPAYHGASAMARLQGENPILSVPLDCLEAARRAQACREHVISTSITDIHTGDSIGKQGGDYRIEFGRIAGEWLLPRFEPYVQLDFNGAMWTGAFSGIREPEDDNCLATRVSEPTSGVRFLSCTGIADSGTVSASSGFLDITVLQAIETLISDVAPTGTYALGIGRVVDEAGVPIAGAVVQPFGAITWYPSQGFNVMAQQIGTASHGYFVLIGSEPYWISGSPISVIASAEQGAGQSDAHVLVPGSVTLFPVTVSPPPSP